MSAVVKIDNVSMRFVIHHNKARSFQDALVNILHQRSGSVEEFWALKDVSFEVNHGETLGIIGENGSGKSTILKLITKILEPTRGEVTVNGRVSALIELGAGFHPDLSGRENIYLNGSIMGFSRKDMDRRFDDIVAFAELEKFIDTPVKHYSSGMYARLGFSVAVSVDPDILIIDEVLSVGDEVFQRKCHDRISEFRRQGKTIIIVSHGLPLIEQLCDQIVWLHHGKLLAQGNAAPTIRLYLAELQQHDEENRLAAHRSAESAAHEVEPTPREALTSSIHDVRFLDGEGVERYSFRTGETLSVLVRYSLHQRPGEYQFSLELRRSDGLLIHRTTEKLVGEAGDQAAEGTVQVQYLNLPLLSGSFEVTPAICRIVDGCLAPEAVIGPGCKFSVWDDGIEDGIVSLPHEWSCVVAVDHDASPTRDAVASVSV